MLIFTYEIVKMKLSF